MPISFPFALFSDAASGALRWIRLERSPPAPDPRLLESEQALRRAVERLPPHLRRDVLRDE